MNLLKRYLFWTYERGSFHYDVMVTLILLFIFVSPRFIHFGDKPVPAPEVHGHDVLVQASGGGVFVYQVSAAELTGGQDLQQSLAASIEPITGPVQLDAYVPVKDLNGKIIGYKVTAHRASGSQVRQ